MFQHYALSSYALTCALLMNVWLDQVYAKLHKVDITDADTLSRAVMEGYVNQRLAGPKSKYEEFTRLAETRLAQNTLNYISKA